jgi:hypothetical protein
VRTAASTSSVSYSSRSSSALPKRTSTVSRTSSRKVRTEALDAERVGERERDEAAGAVGGSGGLAEGLAGHVPVEQVPSR